MKISELQAALEELKQKHGDGNIWASCNKNNLFYEPIVKWCDLEYWNGSPEEGALICAKEYGTIAGKEG